MAQTKNINIIPNSAITRVHVSQGDVGRTIYFNLYEGSLAYTPTSGDIITCVGTKPSGLGFTVACTWSGNVVTCVTTEAMTDESGSIDAELVITSSDETTVLGTSNFRLCVEANPHTSDTTDGTQTTADSLQVQITANATNIATNASDISDLDTRVTTLEGGTITTDTTLSVSGMPADAETVGDEVSDLTNHLDTLADEAKTGIFEMDFCDYVLGAVNNQTGENTTSVFLYRISSSDWFSVTETTEVYIDSAFKINAYYKTTGSSYSGTYITGVTGSYTLSAGKDYKITILRVTEDASETADIATFASKLTYYSDIKNSLEDVTTLMTFRNKYGGYEDITDTLTVVDGAYVALYSIGSNSSYEYVAVPVTEDSKIKVTTNANSAARVAIYFSSSTISTDTYIGTESVTYPDNYGIESFTDYELTIPDGATYVFINNHKSSGDLIVYEWSDGFVADLVTGYEGKNILCLGDSITQLGTGATGWIRYFDRIVHANQIDNVAVVGAHWCDYNSSTTYDGDPQATGDEQNVVGNQVQKIINNPSDYLSEYDVIIIAAGTNDTTSTGELTTSEIDTAYFDSGAVRALSDVDRSTWAGATRWVTESLRELFPTATIVYNTPINRINGYTSARVLNNAKMVRQCAEVNSVLMCDSLHCGVTMSDTNDFVDNLHPSVQGAEKLGTYNAHWFMNNIK